MIKGLSLEAQQESLEEYARERGWVIVGVYIDAAKTARKSLGKRTNFLRMLGDVKQDKVDLILFTRLDRWFRSVADYYKVMEILEAHNCGWLKLPVRVQRIYIVKDKVGSIGTVDFNKFVVGTDKPVFTDPTAGVHIFLLGLVIPCRAGGKDLYHQIRRAMDAVRLDLVRVTNYHEIGNELVVLVQIEVHAIGNRGTLFPIQIIAKKP